MEQAPTTELLYHPDPTVRRQGVELSLAAGEAPLEVDDAGVVTAPRGVHGPLLRLLLAAPAAMKERVRTLYLALDAESLALLPRLVELPDLRALHLLGDGALDLAPLEALPGLTSLVLAGSRRIDPLSGLERLVNLRSLVLRRTLDQPPDLRALRQLRQIGLGDLSEQDDLRFLPGGIEGMHFASQSDDGGSNPAVRLPGTWYRDLRRFPIQELTLPDIPADLSPSDLPSLRVVRTDGEDRGRLLRWPLESLRLIDPTDAALRALADHPTLRHLALAQTAARSRQHFGDPPGPTLRFSPSALDGFSHLQVFDPFRLPLSRGSSLPWPSAARCPHLWLNWLSQPQLRYRIPPEVEARSRSGWWADGNCFSVRGERRYGFTIFPVGRALRALWDITFWDASGVVQSAFREGVSFLSRYEAHTLQALLLAYGHPASIQRMIDAGQVGPGEA